MLVFLAKAPLVVALITGYVLGWGEVWPWLRAAAVVIAPLLVIILAKNAMLWMKRSKK